MLTAELARHDGRFWGMTLLSPVPMEGRRGKLLKCALSPRISPAA
jgi:hypothetical protein